MRCVIGVPFELSAPEQSLALGGAPKYNDFYILVDGLPGIVNIKITFVIFLT